MLQKIPKQPDCFMFLVYSSLVYIHRILPLSIYIFTLGSSETWLFQSLSY